MRIKAYLIVVIFSVIIFSGCKDNKRMSWLKDFNYTDTQVYNLSFINSCPYITVVVNGKKIKLGFDTGNGMGIFLTTAVKGKVDYEENMDNGGSVYQTNPDGTYRGQSTSVMLKSIRVFGDEYSNVMSTISDWKMYSGKKFNGTIGLRYFKNKIITIDYKNKKFATNDKPIDYSKLENKNYTVIPLIKSNVNEESDLLFFNGEVNGKLSTIYLDTGSSRSFVNFGNQKGTAHVKLGDKQYECSNLMTDKIGFRGDFQYPLRFAMNSDLLKSKKFTITIDEVKNKLIIH